LVENNYGYTPLHYADRNRHLDQIPYPILKKNFELIKDTENIESILAEAKLKFAKEIVNKIKKPTSTTIQKP
jgi:hypothetical protein